MDTRAAHARRAWAFLTLLAILSTVLGVLQYHWIGEVSRAERERLRESLQASLHRLGQELNLDIHSACAALIPAGTPDPDAVEAAYLARYLQWRDSGQYAPLFRRIALVVPHNEAPVLRRLDPDRASFEPWDWPASWSQLRERITERLTNTGSPGPFRASTIDESAVIDLPRFPPPQSPGGPREPRPRKELDWLIVELDLDYLRTSLLPDLLHRHLGASGNLDYRVAVTLRDVPSAVVYPAVVQADLGGPADAAALIFEVQYDLLFRRAAPGPPPRTPPAGDRGRWLLSVRHQSGSLEAVVSRTRWRNLGVATAILLLMLAAAAALVRFTQRAQRLAHMQMEFVAGVSHELRTPLSVIRTAAHNLSGGLVSAPQQIKRYGALIQGEAERLTAIVEQVLRFAEFKAGGVLKVKEPIGVGPLIDDSVSSTLPLLDESRCVVEKQIEDGLPPVLADPVSLQHAVQNLLTNAAKYGSEGGWIGISASRAEDDSEGAVVIRVADRGPGIPPEELSQVFDPFYRGKRAIEDQIRGTGLGLNLVKRIVEAHGGTVAVKSEPGRGTEFALRIPAVPAEQRDEFANPVGRG